MPTVVLTIGLNSNRTLLPLPRRERQSFIDTVSILVERNSTTVYVNGAKSLGSWQDDHTGHLVYEESRTWVADVPDPAAVAAILPTLCERHEQDAIALTIGTTELVGSRQLVNI